MLDYLNVIKGESLTLAKNHLSESDVCSVSFGSNTWTGNRSRRLVKHTVHTGRQTDKCLPM